MTCKDCYHYEACIAWVTGEVELKEILGEEGCEYFKDKSKIIELPCKVGDTVYYISGIGIKHNLVKSAIVNEIIINCDGISDLFVSADYCDFEDSFDIFFLTRDEAETKLKELNKQ